MLERQLYEYAVIRVVPRVEREEFINIGLIFFSKRSRYIRVRYILDEKKLNLFSSELDIESLRLQLRIFDRVCSGSDEGGVIASLEVAERFRWLTAVKSASIQTSRPHPGFSTDLDCTFDRLFQELVL